MTDFIEIDFIEAGDRASGDAISIRHRCSGHDCIYVVDGGYTDDGQKLIEHISKYYQPRNGIDHVVLTHPDNDHASGLETLLKSSPVKCLWMNRPWEYVDQLMPKFQNYSNSEQLIRRLKKVYSIVADLEQLAFDRDIEIKETFQGDKIGEFIVLSPSLETYLDLIVESDKTPAPARGQRAMSAAQWGEENLKGDTDGTSPENETSVVQYGDICGCRILLTGDAGVRALAEAHVYIEKEMGIPINRQSVSHFQIPHHGSRRNLSSDVLDAWLGPQIPSSQSSTGLRATVSANQNDSKHPKKAVVRALIHRGRRVFQTEGTLRHSSSDAPPRHGWSRATPLVYPEDQEDY